MVVGKPVSALDLASPTEKIVSQRDGRDGCKGSIPGQHLRAASQGMGSAAKVAELVTKPCAGRAARATRIATSMACVLTSGQIQSFDFWLFIFLATLETGWPGLAEKISDRIMQSGGVVRHAYSQQPSSGPLWVCFVDQKRKSSVLQLKDSMCRGRETRASPSLCVTSLWWRVDYNIVSFSSRNYCTPTPTPLPLRFGGEMTDFF